CDSRIVSKKVDGSRRLRLHDLASRQPGRSHRSGVRSSETRKLKQRVNEWCGCGTAEDNQNPYQQSHEDHRQQPPFLVLHKEGNEILPKAWVFLQRRIRIHCFFTL